MFDKSFRERLSVYVRASLPFGFEGGVWDPIVEILDHFCSFYYISLLVLRVNYGVWSQDYITFFMFNSAEQKILNNYKCESIRKFCRPR